MRCRMLVVAGLLILLVESAARSTARPRIPVDPGAGLDAGGLVPATVASTLRRACFDCHSDETRWPWYSALPVAWWLLERDVNAGRGQLNFSRWTEYNRFDRADLLDRACELVTKREMPLWQYRLAHRDARIDAADIAALCAWSRAEAAALVEQDR